MTTTVVIQIATTVLTCGALFTFILGLLKIKPERAKLMAEGDERKASADKIVAEAMEKVSAVSLSLLDPSAKQLKFFEERLIESNQHAEHLNKELTEVRNKASEMKSRLADTERQLDHFRVKVEQLQSELQRAYDIIEGRTDT